MKIIKIQGREIFDSRAIPALECEITLKRWSQGTCIGAKWGFARYS